jgi:hypothetical protein
MMMQCDKFIVWKEDFYFSEPTRTSRVLCRLRIRLSYHPSLTYSLISFMALSHDLIKNYYYYFYRVISIRSPRVI